MIAEVQRKVCEQAGALTMADDNITRKQSFDARLVSRCFAELECTLKSSAGRCYAGIVENVSENGCFVSILHGESLDSESVVALSLTNYPVIPARVVWSLRSKIGLRFISPLKASVVQGFVKQSLLQRLERFRPEVDPIKPLPPLANWDRFWG